jgi:GT2 family glycosyltransferase
MTQTEEKTEPQTSAAREGHAPRADVSIVYVNWNCAEEIAASIETVRRHTTSCRYEVIVVDNDSPQGPGPLESDEAIKVVRSGRNGGFGAGCNLGAQIARGRFVLFLNPDTRLLNDTVGELLRFLDVRPWAGVAGPMLEDSAGNVQFDGGRSLPTLLNEFLQHSTLAFRFPGAPFASRPYLSDWDHRSTREVESVMGACMLMRAEVFQQIGGFDEEFFLYSEEVDLCHRLRKAGYEVWYVHTARILHKERQSTIQLFGSVSRIVLQNLKSQHYYFRKHYGALAAYVWRNMIAVLYLLRYLAGRDKAHLEYFKWAIAA